MSIETLCNSPRLKQWTAHILLALSVCMMATYWLHLKADPPSQIGVFHLHDPSGDRYTDEGWAVAAAERAALLGHWRILGDLNFAVDAPLWPILLYLPFKLLGVSVALARGIAVGFYAGTILLSYCMVRRLDTPLNAAWVAAILSTNHLGFVFGRMALFEAVWTFFVVASLLLAIHAAKSGSSGLALVSGMVLSLGILTKLTAVFALIPLLTVFWTELGVSRRFWRMAAAAVSGCVILPLLHRIAIIKWFESDHLYYIALNIAAARVHSVRGLLHNVLSNGYHLWCVGLFLFVCFACGVILMLVRFVPWSDALTRLALVWFAADFAISLTKSYFPPRYCFSFLVPVTILTVKCASAAVGRNRLIGGGLYALLFLSLATDMAVIVSNLTRPSYTVAAFADAVRAQVSQGPPASCAFMGNFANTLTLFNGLPSENDHYGTSTMEQRIRHCAPAVYITKGLPSPYDQAQFQATGRSLQFVRSFDVLGNYASGQQVYLYKVLAPAGNRRYTR
jgi:4-amino-4-deoxy-L-arabinose transferase-like glycosyltransferase